MLFWLDTVLRFFQSQNSASHISLYLMATEQSRGRHNPDCNRPRCHPTLNILKQLNCTSTVLQKLHNTLPKEKILPMHSCLFPSNFHMVHTLHISSWKKRTLMFLCIPLSSIKAASVCLSAGSNPTHYINFCTAFYYCQLSHLDTHYRTEKHFHFCKFAGITQWCARVVD